jgi:hypothetical protein
MTAVQNLQRARRDRRRLGGRPPELAELRRRQHDDVVDRRRDGDERDQRVEKIAVGERAAVQGEAQRAEVRLAEDRGDQRCEQVFHQSGDDGAERAADDDRDRQVDHVSAGKKCSESFEHGPRFASRRDGPAPFSTD